MYTSAECSGGGGGGSLYTSAKRPGGTNFRGDIVHYDTGLSHFFFVLAVWCLTYDMHGVMLLPSDGVEEQQGLGVEGQTVVQQKHAYASRVWSNTSYNNNTHKYWHT